MPCGTKQPTNRGLGLAAVCASATPAGIMASSSGRARVAPAPRRTVRRDMCFFVRKFMDCGLLICDRPARGLARRPFAIFLYFHVHLERRALYDAQHQGRELVP